MKLLRTVLLWILVSPLLLLLLLAILFGVVLGWLAQDEEDPERS